MSPPTRRSEPHDRPASHQTPSERSGTPEGTTTRPRLGMSDEAKAFRMAQAEAAIREHALAVEAVRVLEGIARGPIVRSPLTMARALRELADHFEAAA